MRKGKKALEANEVLKKKSFLVPISIGYLPHTQELPYTLNMGTANIYIYISDALITDPRTSCPIILLHICFKLQLEVNQVLCPHDFV